MQLWLPKAHGMLLGCGRPVCTWLQLKAHVWIGHRVSTGGKTQMEKRGMDKG